MQALRLCVHDAVGKVDPTGTGQVRRRFESEMKRRFNALKNLIRTAIIEMDVLGIGQSSGVEKRLQAAMFNRVFKPTEMAMGDAVPSTRAFAFARRSDQVAAFMEWLREEQARGILGVARGAAIRQSADQSWMNIYI